MLILSATADGFPDDADPALLHRLPLGLEPAPGPDGAPQVLLARAGDGGLLALRLAPRWPEMGESERPVRFAGGRFRLLLDAPGGGEAGGWHETPVGGGLLVDRSLALDAVEHAIARRLAAGGEELVEVEAELEIVGRAPTWPWQVRLDGATLAHRLAALLGSESVPWQEVDDAFAGLADDLFDWHPLAPAAVPPPPDEARRAIAWQAAPWVLEESGGRFRLGTPPPESLALSLAVARPARRTVGLRWSFSEFLARSADPSRHLVEVTAPEPFEAAELQVVNDLPLAAAGIVAIAVEVETGGPSGVVRHTFRPGEPGAARLRFVREGFEELALAWRARATVMTARGPAVVSTEREPCGLLLELTAESVGLTPLRVAATEETFAHADRFEVALGSRTVTLAPEARETWAVGRRPPASAALTALLASGERRPLGDLPVVAGAVTVDAAALGVGEVVNVALRPPADLEERSAYLAVQPEGGPWRTLEAGAELAWPVPRSSRLEPPRLRYRCRHVPRDEAGATLPIVESGWREASGDTVEVAP